MTKIITTILALAMVILDIIAYRRLKKSGAGKPVVYIFCSTVLFSYLLILLTPLFMFVFITAENSQFMMKFSMSILTCYLFFSVARLFMYAFWLPTRSRKWMWTGVAVSSLLFASLMYGALVTRTDIEVKEVETRFTDLPESFDGYKIAFISDIHIGSMWDAVAELENLANTIRSVDADIVLFGGDLVNIHHSELSSDVLEKLALIKGRDGVFAVLGNHDTGSYVNGSTEGFREQNKESLEQAAGSAGWVFLKDSTVYIKRGSDSIAITGVDYSEELLDYKHSMKSIDDFDVSHMYNNVPDNVFNITVSHLPQLWHSLCSGGYSDLTLSGHIHAMQMKIGPLSPAALMYDEWSGLYEGENGKLYINDGIGSVGFFARIGARPEVTVLELKCEM